MTFEEILDQALAMLQRRGRVTYSALKRQFNLDDAFLEDLQEELLHGQRLVTEEDGRVLVWRGGASTPDASAALAAPPQESADSGQYPRGASPPTGAGPADAERRQLTVLFCDLVDSTVLSRQLDPEDLRVVVRAYQDTCARVIARYDGHIAQYLGDGLLVYFGYPRAHEDDAQRAVRAGLGMVEALGQLNARLEQEQGVRLAVRLGVHTGLVVANDTGERRWDAELHRLRGEILLARSAEQHAEAETCFRQALDIAHHQQAKSLELRAAMSLARLWQRQSKRTEACALLAPIYGWFTEGFDTADLQEARALLAALA